MSRYITDCEVVLTGSDNGNRVTVTGKVKNVSLDVRRDWSKPEQSIYEFYKPHTYTLTFVPDLEGKQVTLKLSGVERIARVWIPRLNEHEVSKARTKAKVSSDCEFEVEYFPEPESDKVSLHLIFKWWEN